MHHFRGRLLEGSEPRLDPANVYVEYLGPQDGTKSNWNGYLLIGEENAVAPGISYTLELSDGRSGVLAIDHIEPDPDSPDRFRAVFFSETPLA